MKENERNIYVGRRMEKEKNQLVVIVVLVKKKKNKKVLGLSIICSVY